MIIAAMLSLFVAVQQPNMLFVILDDVGEDMRPWMPEMESLAKSGLRLDAFWAQPFCSPFRASLLTGEQGFATGMTGALRKENVGGPPLGVPTMFDIPGYSTMMLGKWHASRWLPEESFMGPVLYGCDVLRGTPGNLPSDDFTYWDWMLTTSFQWSKSEEAQTQHATRWLTDETICRVQTLEEPWIIWTSHHAAHHPFQPPGGGSSQRDRYERLVLFLDSEVSRLLKAVDMKDTYVFVVADNGTPEIVTETPGRSKGYVYEPGVQVPCFVLGPGVRAGSTQALVSVVDFMPTAWELAGESVPALGSQFSGRSIRGLLESDIAHHDYVYAEVTRPFVEPLDRHLRAIRGERYKLIRDVLAGTNELFDLWSDPDEQLPLQPPLIGERQAAWEALTTMMDSVPLP